MEVWLRLDPQWGPKEQVFTNGTEGNLLADGTALMMIVGGLRIGGCGSRLNLKDGDDLGQIDQDREVLQQTFDDDFSAQYFFKNLETIFVEQIGKTEFDL